LAGPKKRPHFEAARDRLFHEIHRCGVLKAADEDVEGWLEDTVEYLAEQYPSLRRPELAELQTIGCNYAAPVIPHGNKDATNRDEWADGAD
jgi:hypothetical protein